METSAERIERLFLSEYRDIITLIEKELLNLEDDPESETSKENLLIQVHTLKGSSSMIEAKILPGFIHKYESLIKSIFSHNVFNSSVFTFLLKGLDYISFLVDNIIVKKVGINMNKYNNNIKKLLMFEKKLLGNLKKENYGVFSYDKNEEKLQEKELYRISMELNEKRNFGSWHPEEIIDDLKKMGNIIRVAGLPFKVINWPDDDFSQCFFRWDIFLESKEPLKKIEEVFIFFKSKNKIVIEPVSGNNEAESENKSKNITKQTKAIDKGIKEEITKDQSPKNMQTLVQDIVKVPIEKIDTLIDTIGELIIINSNLNNLQMKLENMELDNIWYNLNKVAGTLRENIISMKMTPVGHLFSRFHRMVRDISRKFNKDIKLIIKGENTQLDRTIFSILQDAIVHIIINAIDHGIESSEERKKLEKSQYGYITIEASEESGQIVIEIKDDGKGLDREKILKKAIEKGLLNESTVYSESEIFDVIFKPGFSTKDEVSVISGRGIGMDAVMASIKKINGSIKIVSEKGKGTQFIIKLPLTLVIIDGFLLKIGLNHFVIPLNFVLECFEVDLNKLKKNDMVYDLRGEYLSVKMLNTVLNNINYIENDSKLKQVVVIELDNDKIGFLVDEIKGNVQVVIRPVSKIINIKNCLLGSTLLGDGEIALILDIRNLLKKIAENE